MLQIAIKKEVFYEMLFHCLQESPREACGCLAGAGEVIEEMHKMPSLENGVQRFDPSESFRLSGKIKKRGGKILAVFRSHADTDHPTPHDIASHPGAVQFVVAVSQSGLPTVRAYAVESGRADEIHIEIE